MADSPATAIEQKKKPFDGKISGEIAGVSVFYADAAEKRKLTMVLNKLKKIETGRRALAYMAKRKTFLFLENISAYGGYESDSNFIVLGAKTPVDKLCSTLVHEVRHAEQAARGGDSCSRNDLNLKSQIMSDRAKEADAQTFALISCFEWAAIGDQKPFQAFVKATPQMYNCFCADRNIKKFKSGSDAEKAALFKAFYKQNDILDLYENSYMLLPALSDMNKILTGSADTNRRYTADTKAVNLSAQQVADMTAAEYMLDAAEFIGSKEALCVRPATKDVLKTAFALTGRVDVTLDTLPENAGFSNYKVANAAANKLCGIHYNFRQTVAKAVGKSKTDIDELLKKDVSEQAQTLKDCDAETLKAFRRAKLCERAFGMFNRFNSIHDAKCILSFSKDEDKRAAAEKILAEQTKGYAEDRAYIVAGCLIEDARERRPDIVAKTLASKNLPASVRQELTAENEKLFKPVGNQAEPLNVDRRFKMLSNLCAFETVSLMAQKRQRDL